MLKVTEKAEINEIVGILQKLDNDALRQILISANTLAAYLQITAENKKTA